MILVWQILARAFPSTFWGSLNFFSDWPQKLYSVHLSYNHHNFSCKRVKWNPVSVRSWHKWEVETGQDENLMEVSRKKRRKTSPCPTMKLTMKKCAAAKAGYKMVGATLHPYIPITYLPPIYSLLSFLPGPLLPPACLLGPILVPN